MNRISIYEAVLDAGLHVGCQEKAELATRQAWGVVLSGEALARCWGCVDSACSPQVPPELPPILQ